MQLRSARLAVTSALALSLASLSASAQNSTDAVAAARRELIERAQAARGTFDHARALELAQQASQLSMTPSLRRFIAEEQVVLGDLPSALTSAQACVRESEREPASPTRDEHLSACRGIVTSLQNRVARIVVTVAAGVDRNGLEVRVSDHLLAPVEIGVSRYVMLGAVVVEAHNANGGVFRQELTVNQGETANVTVILSAGALIRRTGDHRNRVEFEGHLTAYNPLYCHGAGFGGGARAGIPLVRNGFVPSINNNVVLSFGADLFYNSDQRCRSTAIHVPVALQWNFFVDSAWSVFFEPTVLVTLPVNTGNCSESMGRFETGCNEILVMPGASVGARWHFNGDGRYPTVMARVGWPVGFNLGMTF